MCQIDGDQNDTLLCDDSILSSATNRYALQIEGTLLRPFYAFVRQLELERDETSETPPLATIVMTILLLIKRWPSCEILLTIKKCKERVEEVEFNVIQSYA